MNHRHLCLAYLLLDLLPERCELAGDISLDVAVLRDCMIENRDIWRVAHLLIRHHGSEAVIVAARRFQALRKAGDVKGCADWRLIITAVGELARTKPLDDKRLH